MILFSNQTEGSRSLKPKKKRRKKTKYIRLKRRKQIGFSKFIHFHGSDITTTHMASQFYSNGNVSIHSCVWLGDIRFCVECQLKK